MSYYPEYMIWANMKDRCLNPNNKYYFNYGGRGISVEPSWIKSFEAFIQDVGKRPSKAFSLDRLDNNKGYIKGNVSWQTRTKQMNNTRRNVILFYKNKKMTLVEFCKLVEPYNVSQWFVRYHLFKNKTPDEIVKLAKKRFHGVNSSTSNSKRSR